MKNLKRHISIFNDLLNKSLFIMQKQGFRAFSSKLLRYFMHEKKHDYLKFEKISDDLEKFPNKDSVYKKSIATFLNIAQQAKNKSGDDFILFFDHELGGGANVYRNNFIEDSIRSKKIILLVTYDFNRKEFLFTCKIRKEMLRYSLNGLENLNALLSHFEFEKIIMSDVVSYPSPLGIIKYISDLKAKRCCLLEILIHDYFCITPYVVLLGDEKKYLKGQITRLNSIVRKEFSIFVPRQEKDIYVWEKSWFKILNESDSIICFSQSSSNMMHEYYPNLNREKISIVPHKISHVSVSTMHSNNKKQILTIGILGNIRYIKGSEIIKEMVQIVDRKKLHVKIVVIGELHERIRSKNLVVTGRYDYSQMNHIISKQKIDIFFISSIFLETFSYTTEEIIRMKVPIAAFDLGAPAERISTYEKGMLIPIVDAEAALNRIIEFSKVLFLSHIER